MRHRWELFPGLIQRFLQLTEMFSIIFLSNQKRFTWSLHVVIQQLSELGLLIRVLWSWGSEALKVRRERGWCLIVLVTAGHLKPLTLRGCRCSRLRSVRLVTPGLTPAYKSKVTLWEQRAGMIMPDTSHTRGVNRPGIQPPPSNPPNHHHHTHSFHQCPHCAVTDSSDWSAACRGSNTEDAEEKVFLLLHFKQCWGVKHFVCLLLRPKMQQTKHENFLKFYQHPAGVNETAEKTAEMSLFFLQEIEIFEATVTQQWRKKEKTCF